MEKGSSTPLQPAVPLEDPPRETGRPGSDAWTPDPAAPGGTPAREASRPARPGRKTARVRPLITRASLVRSRRAEGRLPSP
jgi:hypothetical protein